MSSTSPARRFWTRPLTRRPAPRPAGAVGRTLELLEDRTNPAITLNFTAGVATFTSDGASDTLQVQATADPANILYNSGGIGLASLTGVTQLVFNGNAGADVLILQSPAGTHFAPVNGIVYNAGGDAADRLDMIGGAATWTGTYAPTGTQTGSLSFTNAPGTLTQNITFTGLPTIRNSMSGTTMAVTTPGANDTINVETGPNLGDIGVVQQGPVLIDGGDRDDHGSFGPAQNIWAYTTHQHLEDGGWSLAANANITDSTTVPHTTVTSTAATNTVGNADFYGFDVTVPGSVGTFDIDGAAGVNTFIAIYDHHGTLLATNDNAAADAGNSLGTESFLTYTFPEADEYFVVVTRSSGGVGAAVDNGILTSNGGVNPGASYTLHVSIDNHPVTAPPLADSAPEVEPNEFATTNPAGNRNGWKFIEQGVRFVRDSAFNEVSPGVPPPLANTILAIGVTGSTALNAINSVASVLGMSVQTVTGAAIGTVNFNDYRVLYVPSNSLNTGGGITQPDLTALNLRTTDIRDFINSGGGIFALTEANSTNPYGWLQIPNPFTIQSFGGGGISNALRKTPAALSAGVTITDLELSNGVPYHNVFTGPVGFNNLLPFVLDTGPNNVADGLPAGFGYPAPFGDDRVVALGLGAITNSGLGGAGPSTAITFGTNPTVSPTFPTMYITATPGLSLDGAAGGDTYNIQLGTPVITSIAVADAGGSPDVANLFGTTAPESFNVNSAAANTVFYVGPTSETVTFAGLETLTIDGKSEPNTPSPVTGDTFTVRPVAATAITVTAGDPIIYPGDTLAVDLVGLVGLNPTISDPALPDGNLTLTGYGTLTWTGIENFPVPRGLGGSFDFGTATSPVQFGFTQVLPTSTYPAAATAGTGWFGWATTPLYGNQAYQEPNLPPAVAASPVAALLQDFAYGFQGDPSNGVFRVDVAPNKPVQLTALVGVPVGGRDGLVVEWGVANSPTGLPTTWTAITPAGGLFTTGGEMTTVSAALTAADVGNNLSLFVRFRDVVGEPNWSISALDVRPTNPTPPLGQLIPAGLVAPLPLRREFSTNGVTPSVPEATYADQHAFAAVAADGLTVDYFRGKDAIPGSLVTITVSNGTPVDAAFTAGDMALATRLLNPDAAGYLQQFQVQADAAGEFTFGVRRPTGTAPATVTAADATGFRAGAYTQPFVLPNARRLDFGPLPAASTSDYGNGGTVGAGYVPFAAATYTDAATNALGWTGANLPVPFAFGGTGTAVQRDAVFGGYAPSEFVLDMPAGDYVVTATLGDQGARRDDMFVEVWNGSAWVVARGFNPATNAYDTDLNGLTSPPGVAPDAGQSLVRSFLATTAGGQIRVRFGNVTGNPNWTLAALEVRPAQAALTITRAGGALTADGSTVTAYTVTGAAPGTVLTVRTALGSPAGADANTTYDGFQVVVPASGPTFSVKAPYSTTVVTSVIEVESVSGGERGTLAESYAATTVPTVPAVRRFDFNGASDDTNPNMVGVRGNQLWTAGADYGWLTAVNEFERATTSLPASMTAAQKALFRDGATLGGPAGTFRVKVDAGADYAVRYYVGDSYKKWPWIRLQVEGGTASGQLATNVNQYWSYVMFGKDADGDGYLDVKVYGTATWVLNAVDVAKGTTAAALPPSLLAASPQLAGFAVTSGTAPTLTAAELAPIVVEATRRLVAAGADPGRLAAVTVSILDLNAAGRLGEHVPGSVHIDDDAGGAGWFVDPTPADDAEFGSSVAFGLGATDGAAARGVDLLTVVMHELSHELGLADLDPTANPADLMAEALDVGVRRLPAGLASAERPAPVDVPPARPTTTEKPSAGTVLRPTPALWLAVADPVFAPGLPVVATDDRVRATVAPVEPVLLDPAAATPLAPSLAATPAWPDADSLFDLDGVYVG
ncbi:pre-peptidase C-terminal domain-containing protein [Urbifossiella limnaea]|uniref:Uncharacterized protein n=1 Tax=Urbifossiella limnaea TaxID=2528023 RepID=A0A517Y269_9BACT|nr:pre-peptidase C-terminal domain-containing protein [Urbifossiella limnaea]QDU23876.1 hypothetical protein ETAA1_58860 [Urbifossiella limnaea]